MAQQIKVLAVQYEYLSINSQHPHKKPSKAIYNPSSVWGKDEYQQGLLATSIALGSVREPVQRKYDKKKCYSKTFGFCVSHGCTQLYACIHITHTERQSVKNSKKASHQVQNWNSCTYRQAHKLGKYYWGISPLNFISYLHKNR